MLLHMDSQMEGVVGVVGRMCAWGCVLAIDDAIFPISPSVRRVYKHLTKRSDSQLKMLKLLLLGQDASRQHRPPLVFHFFTTLLESVTLFHVGLCFHDQ